MPDRLDFTLTVRNAGADGAPIQQVFQGQAVETYQKNVIDLYKSHYAEAMHIYRYFGTLRAQITWFPAIISVTLLSYFSDKVIFDIEWMNFLTSGFLFLILLFIFLANYYLQKKQKASTQASKTAQAQIKSAIEGDIPDLHTFYDILNQARPRFFVKPDGASLYLLLFFLTLIIGHGFMVYWRIRHPAFYF